MAQKREPKMETYYKVDKDSSTCSIYVEHGIAQSYSKAVYPRAKRALEDGFHAIITEATFLISEWSLLQANYSSKDFDIPEGRTLTEYVFEYK